LDGELGGEPVEDGFDEEFGFGARDEGVAGDAEVVAVELLDAGEVLKRFVSGAARDDEAEGVGVLGVELGFGVSEEPGAVADEEVGEERLGVTAGDLGGGFDEEVADGHGSGESESRGWWGEWQRRVWLVRAPEKLQVSPLRRRKRAFGRDDRFWGVAGLSLLEY
jgi:hypothetical protein